MGVAGGGKVEVAKFHVAGTWSPSPFVVHVGLVAADTSISLPDENAAVFQCAPPIEIGVLPGGAESKPGKMVAHIVGWTDLSTDQRIGMETWLVRMRTMISQSPPASATARKKRDYIVHPHTDDVVDSVDGSVCYRRFSCAGFVFACYDEGAQIQLVDIGSLPPAHKEMLMEWYGFDESRFTNSAPSMGLAGPGPWPVLLPGYLINSLARTSTDMAFIATIADAYYPRSVAQAEQPSA